MTDPTTGGTDRAVSELLGYILIFSLVTLSATSVFVLGTTQLENTRDTERLANAEKAFEVLASNVDDHISEGALGRSTEVRIADADLYLDEGEELRVNISHTDPAVLAESDNYTREINPITYESTTGSKVVYSNGAVFRDEADHSYMVHEPTMMLDDDRAVIPVIRTTGDDSVSGTGSDVVQVRTEETNTRYLDQADAETEPYTVEISIETTPQRAEMWEGYFRSTEAHEGCSGTASGDLTCTFRTYEVYVPIAIVDTEIN